MMTTAIIVGIIVGVITGIAAGWLGVLYAIGRITESIEGAINGRRSPSDASVRSRG